MRTQHLDVIRILNRVNEAVGGELESVKLAAGWQLFDHRRQTLIGRPVTLGHHLDRLMVCLDIMKGRI